MAKLTLEEATLHIEKCPEPPATVTLSLTALRLVSLFMPPEDSLRLGGDADLGLVDLETVTDEGLAEFVAHVATLEAEGAPCALFLEDYAGRYASISIQDIRDSGIALFEEIHRYRGQRRAKLASWAKSMLGLVVTGLQGDMVTFDLEGVRASSCQFLAWKDLDRIDVHSGPAEESTYRFIPREGVPAEGFSGRIPARKARLLMAEHAFWRSLSRRQTEDPLWRASFATT